MSLLEREDELSVLDELVARAVGGEGRVAVLAGPPGIGKTALLAAVRQRASARAAGVDRGGRRTRPRSALRRGSAAVRVDRCMPVRDADDVLSGAAGLAAPVFALGGEHRAVAALGDVVHGLYWLCANLAETAAVAARHR